MPAFVPSEILHPPVCPIHRDFYHDQIVVDATRVYLLDLDLFAMGDPALDTGNFIGHLSKYAMRTLGSPDALSGQQKEMIDHYVELAGEELRPRVQAHSGLTLVRHIYINTLFDDRTRFVEEMLKLSERRIEAILQAFGHTK